MVTDDERREVAEYLRHIDDETLAMIDGWMYCRTNEELSCNAVLNIGLCMAMYEAGFETETLGDFWDLLAKTYMSALPTSSTARPPRATASSRPSTAVRPRAARSAATRSAICGGTIVRSAGR